MADAIDYAALAEQARKSAPVDYAALAEQARRVAPAKSGGNPISEGLEGIGSGAINSLLNAYKALRARQDQVKEQGFGLAVPVPEISKEHMDYLESLAKPPDSFAGKAGHFAENAAEAVLASGAATTATKGAGLLARAGAQAATAAGVTAAQSGGDPKAMALAAATGAGGEVLAPLLAKGIPIIPSLRNANPKVAAAVDAGIQAGVPVDAGTATGNFAVKGAQHLADRSIGGSIANRGGDQAAAEALANRGRDLASSVHPTAVSPEGAGRGMVDAVDAASSAASRRADVAYGKIRQIEADPANLKDVQVGMQPNPSLDPNLPAMVPVMAKVALPVDIQAVKTSLAPVLKQMESDFTPAEQAMNPSLNAIRNIMKLPDNVPISEADRALSSLKGITRKSGSSDPVKHFAGEAIDALESQVQQVASQGGADALKALSAGRAATVDKYAAKEIVDAMRKEPVQAFRQAIYGQDAGIDQLRAIQKFAPGEMPKVGRAFVDDLVNKATEEGSFSKGAKLWSDWANLGPETKKILFNPNQSEDLDKFFLLAKKMAENPNPSGTGHIVSLNAQGLGLLMEPLHGVPLEIGGALLSRFLHSPRGVRLLMNGMRVPVNDKVATAAIQAEIVKMANDGSNQAKP